MFKNVQIIYLLLKTHNFKFFNCLNFLLQIYNKKTELANISIYKSLKNRIYVCLNKTSETFITVILFQNIIKSK